MYLFATNAAVTVLEPFCSQLPLVPVQCTVSFIIYAGPIWSDKPSPSSEVITNNNDDKTQRIFALFWKWLFCVAWGCFPHISSVTWQPFANFLPSDPYHQGHLEAHLGWEPLLFTISSGLLRAEMRLLCMWWISDHYSDRGYFNIL